MGDKDKATFHGKTNKVVCENCESGNCIKISETGSHLTYVCRECATIFGRSKDE